MNKLYILSPIALGVGLIALMSVSRGVAKIQKKDRTGSPVATTNCTACHSSSVNFAVVPKISMVNSSGAEVTEYTPLEKYTLTVSIQSSGNIGHGFQVTGLFGDNTSAGLVTNPSTGTQRVDLNGRWYFEHKQQVTGGVYTVEWSAPASGNGDVTFYGSCLATNGSQSTSGDDFENIPNLVITEGAPSSVTSLKSNVEVKLYPNPTVNEITVELKGEQIEIISIYDVKGNLVKTVKERAISVTLSVADLPTGVYYLDLKSSNGQTRKTFIKE